MIGQGQPVIANGPACRPLCSGALLEGLLDLPQCSGCIADLLGIGQVVKLGQPVAGTRGHIGHTTQHLDAACCTKRHGRRLDRHLRQRRDHRAQTHQVADRLTGLRFSAEGVAAPLGPRVIAVVKYIDVGVKLPGGHKTAGLADHVRNTSAQVKEVGAKTHHGIGGDLAQITKELPSVLSEHGPLIAALLHCHLGSFELILLLLLVGPSNLAGIVEPLGWGHDCCRCRGLVVKYPLLLL